MGVERIEQLTVRQRECLRLYHQRYRVKEIARQLDISENTASGYLTDAAALIGAGGRPAAAAALARYEQDHPETRGRFSVVDHSEALPPNPLSPGNSAPVSEPDAVIAQPRWLTSIPFRQGDGNDLTVAQRFVWLLLITFVLVAGFGVFAIFVRTISDLVGLART